MGMSQRMDISKTVPSGFRAVWGLEQYVAENVDPTVLELVTLRASMLNACSYCVDMHSRDALAAGETAQRLFALAAWRISRNPLLAAIHATISISPSCREGASRTTPRSTTARRPPRAPATATASSRVRRPGPGAT